MSTSLRKENNSPLIIGLTGGIGSGKSTVAKIFESFKIPIFNSDLVARKLVNQDLDVIKEIQNEFGDVYKDRELDKLKLAEIVFNDSKALMKLNNIVHPKVATAFKLWVNKNNNAPFVIKEAAILIESGAHQQVDHIILVTAPKSIRVDRVVKRDNVSIEKVESRMKAQLLDQEKREYANFEIHNDSKTLIIPQVLDIYNRLIVQSNTP